MSLPLIMGCLWVIAATITAMLPMKQQMVPGMTLLVLAPVLLLWIGLAHGLLWVALGLFAFVSMFRRPLIYFARRVLGLSVEVPAELQK
ncbi:DUF2484 family protein [Cypionkella sp.]|uniref:DUF2484 family protein n=1 Tax=Cypionkella sp. TaxID=2811411 RepID=UPI002ABA931E|nr:DUF2484 family protein [Cypionkella sp.]MDZ4395954.1 DUF2484 family protein [Cypionkella sp.]